MKRAYIITTDKIERHTFFEMEEHGYIGAHIELSEYDLKLFELLMELAAKYEKTTKHYKDGESGLYLTCYDCIHNSKLLRQYLKS